MGAMAVLALLLFALLAAEVAAVEGAPSHGAREVAGEQLPEELSAFQEGYGGPVLLAVAGPEAEKAAKRALRRLHDPPIVIEPVPLLGDELREMEIALQREGMACGLRLAPSRGDSWLLTEHGESDDARAVFAEEAWEQDLRELRRTSWETERKRRAGRGSHKRPLVSLGAGTGFPDLYHNSARFWPLRHLSVDIRWSTLMLEFENHAYLYGTAHLGSIEPRSAQLVISTGGGATVYDIGGKNILEARYWHPFLYVAGGLG